MPEELEKKNAEPEKKGDVTDEDVETVTGGIWWPHLSKPLPIQKTEDDHPKR